MEKITFIKYKVSAIPDELKNFTASYFLQTIGFPEVVYYDAFVLSSVEKLELVKIEGKNYCLIGQLFLTNVFLDIESGVIYRYDADGLQFLNQSLKKLTYCVIEYVDFLNLHQGTPNAETLVALENLMESIIKLDNNAEVEDGFWKIFISDSTDVIASEI